MTQVQGDPPSGGLSLGATCLLSLLAGGLMFIRLAGADVWLASAVVAISELGVAAAILLAAGGYGHLVIGRLAPAAVHAPGGRRRRRTPGGTHKRKTGEAGLEFVCGEVDEGAGPEHTQAPLVCATQSSRSPTTSAGAPAGLRVVTACALGLWMLSTAMLIVGSAASGALTLWVWWPVVAVGAVLAAWQGRKALAAWRIPREPRTGVIFWVVVALAVGVWLAGAVRPPGYPASGDSYDVLEYHLQIPREFYEAGRIGQLRHNCFSYYPLGTHMLFLLGMCLRGGAYEGMYVAKLLHGVFLGLAAAGVLTALRRDDTWRARFAAILLATTPVAICLGWTAMSELGPLCYAALGILWLRQWHGDGRRGSAVLIGGMLGAACAAKVLSIGLVAAPVLVVMAGASLTKGKWLQQAPLAAAAAVALMAPWLVRNAVYTGNPVFPLAARTLGAGHWDEQSVQRWESGTAPDLQPPVPTPPGWEPQDDLSRPVRLYHFLISDWYGKIPMALVAAAICLLFAARGAPDRWEWSLVGVLVLQVSVWALWSRGMPLRFIVVAAAPMALLGAGVLSRLARVQINPLLKGATRPAHGPWGMAPAGTLLLFAVAVNLFVAYRTFRYSVRGHLIAPIPPIPGQYVAGRVAPYDAAAALGEGSRVLLIGEARGFYFPAGTRYATVFDTHPLARLAAEGHSPEQILAKLRGMGITHLWVDWMGIWRLGATYGYPTELTDGLYRRWQTSRPPGLKILDRLARHGMGPGKDLFFQRPPTSGPASGPASAPATRPATLPAPTSKRWAPYDFPPHWPEITLYPLSPARATDAASAPAGQTLQ